MSTRHSIRLRLITMLIAMILLVWLAVLVLVYLAAEHEVEEVFDADLEKSAHILQALLQHEVEEEYEMSAKVRDVVEELGTEGITTYPRLAALFNEYMESEGKEQLKLIEATQNTNHQNDSGPVFIARYGDGTTMIRSHSAPEIPIYADGFTDSRLDGKDWRIYSLSEKNTGFVVQVGEEQASRDELVRYITRNTLTPLLLALPVMGALVWIVVGRALASLHRVAERVSMRETDAIEPIDDEDTPHEIDSLLTALNNLFGRVGAAIKRERLFTADAAHELRTPLAALRAHLQVAQAQSNEPEMQRSLNQALDGVTRATHLVEQLLALARADAEQTRTMVNAPLNLRDVAVQVVSAFSQQAVDRGIDLGVDAPPVVSMHGDATALQIMLGNLVDNSVRYTPAGGVVTVSAGTGEDGPWIKVMDNGIGVPVEERKAILNRFHRGAREQIMGTTGSGLGLSIVKRIADLHSAHVRIAGGLNGKGLGVEVVFNKM